jgi:hypothetical protein
LTGTGEDGCEVACSCGFTGAAQDLAEHLGEMFIPADDTGPDGVVHAESAREESGRGCLCGLAFGGKDALDAYLLQVFVTDAGLGLDGARHVPVRGAGTGV